MISMIQVKVENDTLEIDSGSDGAMRLYVSRGDGGETVIMPLKDAIKVLKDLADREAM